MMRPQKNTHHTAGVTLIELLVVIGIVGLLALPALAALRHMQAETALNDAQTTVVEALEKSREKAATGAGGDFGVFLQANDLTLFEGSTFSGTGQEVSLPPSVSIAPASTEVVFKRLKGTASAGVTLILSHDSGRSEEITVTHDGFVDAPQ